MNRHDPLKIFIEDGVLTMCIGVEVLARAIKLDPDLCEPDRDSGDWVEPEITDVDVFASEVMRDASNRERGWNDRRTSGARYRCNERYREWMRRHQNA